MATKEFSLLEDIKEGWRYPYRSKKAHYFINKKSLCQKHIISDYEAGGLLPTSAFFYKEEFCKRCLNEKA